MSGGGGSSAKKRLTRLLRDLRASASDDDEEDLGVGEGEDGSDNDDQYAASEEPIAMLAGRSEDREQDEASSAHTPSDSRSESSEFNGQSVVVDTTRKLAEEFRRRTALLQEQLATLTRGKRQLESQHVLETQRQGNTASSNTLSPHIVMTFMHTSKPFPSRLQARIDALQHQQLADLKARHADQQHDEGRASSAAKRALVNAIEQIQELRCTQSRYDEANALAPGDRSPADWAALRGFEELKATEALLRTALAERDAAREGQARATGEAERAQREGKREAAEATATARDVLATNATLQARVERLERDLEDTIMQKEVLSAKGAMYDEVYLGREVKTLQESLLQTERELERVKIKAADAKRAAKAAEEVFGKARDERALDHEQKLEVEIARIREAATADLERVRREAGEALERELRIIKDSRDAAIIEAQALTVQLREAKRDREDILARMRDAQSAWDSEMAESRTQLRLRAFEADRASALLADSSEARRAADARCSVSVLTERCREVEAEGSKRVAELEGALEAARKLYNELSEGRSNEAVGKQSNKDNTQKVAAQLDELQRERDAVTQQLNTSNARLQEMEEKLSVAKRRAEGIRQPHTYLLERLEACDIALKEKQIECAALKQDLMDVLEDAEALRSALNDGRGSLPQQPQMGGKYDSTLQAERVRAARRSKEANGGKARRQSGADMDGPATAVARAITVAE
eukprot:jgi/Chlat1/765/Chrsp104S01235